MQTIALLGVRCLSCPSCQVCQCRLADAPIEHAALVVKPAENGEGFVFEMIVASAAYVAAIIGMVTVG